MYLIHDRDPLFSKAFIAVIKAGGVKSVKIPAQSPNCNPYAERFVKTIKYECLNQFVIFGERHLRHLVKEFVEHYMTERFHQGIGGQLRFYQLQLPRGRVNWARISLDEPRSSFEHDAFVLIWPFGPPAERADVRTVGFPWYPGAVVEPSAPW